MANCDSLDNRVWKLVPDLWCPSSEELFTLLTDLNGFENIPTSHTRTRMTETCFFNSTHLLEAIHYFIPMNQITTQTPHL